MSQSLLQNKPFSGWFRVYYAIMTGQLYSIPYIIRIRQAHFKAQPEKLYSDPSVNWFYTKLLVEVLLMESLAHATFAVFYRASPEFIVWVNGLAMTRCPTALTRCPEWLKQNTLGWGGTRAKRWRGIAIQPAVKAFGTREQTRAMRVEYLLPGHTITFPTVLVKCTGYWL